MDHAAFDYTDARNLMVDGQLRPNKVYDPRILDAMRRLPREQFVPAPQRALAYADVPVPLGGGRVLLAPMVLARLAQTAAVQVGERVLVIGCGTGYGAAVLAACGASVTALDDDAGLLDLARRALGGQSAIKLVHGPLADGWPAAAPYDVVFIEGAVPEVPATLAAQVRAATGRLIAIRAGTAGGMGQAVLGEPSAGGLVVQPVFDCAAPLLPALRPAPGFVF